MIIKSISFKNYRNLDGIKVFLDGRANYIIGDNGVGKTNFLDALTALFLLKSFKASDFFDVNKSIIIKLTVEFTKEETVKYSLNESVFRIEAEQRLNSALKFKFSHSGERVFPEILNSVNFINYGKLFDSYGDYLNIKGELGDAILNELYPNTALKDIANRDRINLLVNNIVNKLNVGNASENTGNSYAVSVIFTILRRICDRMKYFKGEDKFNCILAFDEPEIHLHSFLQRAFIKNLLNISDDADEDFNELIKMLFSINDFTAQFIIVSHSDRIVSKNYKEIIRFYYERDRLAVKCGNAVNLNVGESEKHLLMRFPYFTEALFSKCVIFAEGECETGAFPVFAERLGVNLDLLCISVVNAGSESNMLPLMRLFEKFGINVIGVKDRDVYEYFNEKYRSESKWIQSGKLFITDNYDFEEEIYECSKDNIVTVLKNAGINLSSPVYAASMLKTIEHYKIEISKRLPDKIFLNKIKNDDELKKLFFLTKLKEIKSITESANIAELICAVPKIYEKIIKSAAHRALNE